MNTVLDEVKSIPGIIGGFVFSLTHGIRSNNLPPVFKEQNLIKIGKVLDKIYSGSKSSFEKIIELSLCYEESTIIVRPIGQTNYLIILCEPSLNQNLLTMTMNMIADEIIKVGAQLDDANDGDNSNTSGVDPFAKKMSAEEIITAGPLSSQLQGMQTALLKIIGPMSKIIFKDAVNDWINSNNPSESTLPDLLEMLLTEINDSEKEERYLEMIAPFMENNKGDI